MANIFEFQKRRVIPNWRSFSTTVCLGELGNVDKLPPLPKLSIDDYVHDWINNKTVTYAGDLISAAIVNNLTDHPEVINAARYILSNRTQATDVQIYIATELTSNGSDNNNIQISADLLDNILSKEPIYQKIRELKITIRRFPRNAIAYVELARLYSILGQNQIADENLKLAYYLSPENRYVLRAISRHFAKSDLDFPHEIIRNSNLVGNDPWITSTEIALATLRDRNSRYIKKGISMIDSNSFHPFNITELSSSIGTVELINGNFKKGRKLFNTSLIAPNDNSMAQSEWASKEFQLTFNLYDTNNPVKRNYEADAFENFFDENWKSAFNNALLWFIDTPYSKRPVQLASHIASSITNSQEEAIKIIRAGLISHPNDPELINNVAYAYGLINKTKEADEYLNKISQGMNLTEKNQICLTATKGLIQYRKGLPDEGRRLYIEAINKAKEMGYQYFYDLAKVNFIREELSLNSDKVSEFQKVINELDYEKQPIEIKVIIDNIRKLK